MATNKNLAPVIVDEAPTQGETVFEKSENTELQEAVDQSSEQGFIGIKTDPKPNEFYTVAGQIAAQKENEAKAAKDAK